MLAGKNLPYVLITLTRFPSCIAAIPSSNSGSGRLCLPLDEERGRGGEDMHTQWNLLIIKNTFSTLTPLLLCEEASRHWLHPANKLATHSWCYCPDNLKSSQRAHDWELAMGEHTTWPPPLQLSYAPSHLLTRWSFSAFSTRILSSRSLLEVVSSKFFFLRVFSLSSSPSSRSSFLRCTMQRETLSPFHIRGRETLFIERCRGLKTVRLSFMGRDFV